MPSVDTENSLRFHHGHWHRLLAASSIVGTSSAWIVNHGVVKKLQMLLPGEAANPGSTTGKTGTPSLQTSGTAFDVKVNAVDANWNFGTSLTDTVAITSNDANAVLPASAALSAGTGTFTVTLKTVGSEDRHGHGFDDGNHHAEHQFGDFGRLGFGRGQTAAPCSGRNGRAGIVDREDGHAVRAGCGHGVHRDGQCGRCEMECLQHRDRHGGARVERRARDGACTQRWWPARNTFSVTLKTAGSQTVTATDNTNTAVSPNTSPAIDRGTRGR